jgi:hypothetical protein
MNMPPADGKAEASRLAGYVALVNGPGEKNQSYPADEEEAAIKRVGEREKQNATGILRFLLRDLDQRSHHALHRDLDDVRRDRDHEHTDNHGQDGQDQPLVLGCFLHCILLRM